MTEEELQVHALDPKSRKCFKEIIINCVESLVCLFEDPLHKISLYDEGSNPVEEKKGLCLEKGYSSLKIG